MEEIINLIVNNGMGVGLMVYFIYKDYKFNEQILSVLNKMETLLGKLETWHSAEDKNNG